MPLRRLDDPSQPCISREHDPPKYISLRPGTYEWTCPDCGTRQVFTVSGVVSYTRRSHPSDPRPRIKRETYTPRPVTAAEIRAEIRRGIKEAVERDDGY